MKSKISYLPILSISLLILVAFLFTSQNIEPFLYYHFQQIGFITGIDSFRSYLSYPGGISDYLGEFITQFFSFNLFGSFLIVAIASTQGFIALYLVSRLKGKTHTGLSVFGIVLLLGVMVLCDYRYPYYASIRLLFSFLFTLIFYLINNKYPKFSIYFWPVFACLLFYLASGPALFVFALSTAAILIYTQKITIWAKAIPLSLLFAGIIPYLGYKFLYSVTLPNLYRIAVVKPPELLAYSTFYQLYLYYSVLPLLLFVFLIVARNSKQVQETLLQKGKVIRKTPLFRNIPFMFSVQVIALAALSYFLYLKSFDPFKKKIISIEYYAENEQWDKILKIAKDIDVYDFRVNFQVNRAYAHLGQLPDRLFTYPQLLGVNGLFYDNSNINGSFTMPNSDLYFDLGFMSESQHWAFEAQTLLPNSPRILKRIIMINLINRKYQLADKFLTVLDKNMLYRDWVNKYQKYVSDTTLAACDPVIAEKRRFNPKKTIVHTNPVEDLKLLLETNQKNRFAYDYLLTYCILDSNFSLFMQYIPLYSTFNIKTLPHSWEEALSFYIIKTKKIPPFVTEETVSKGCLQRISQFNKTVKQFNNDIVAAKNTLRSNFEDTYWYYLLYLNPKVTNVLKNKTQVQ